MFGPFHDPVSRQCNAAFEIESSIQGMTEGQDISPPDPGLV